MKGFICEICGELECTCWCACGQPNTSGSCNCDYLASLGEAQDEHI